MIYSFCDQCLKEGKKQQRPSFPPMDWNFDGNEYDPMIPNDYERVVRGKYMIYFLSSKLLKQYIPKWFICFIVFFL